MDIMFIYDVLNNFVSCPDILYLIGFIIPSRSTCNIALFHIPKV